MNNVRRVGRKVAEVSGRFSSKDAALGAISLVKAMLKAESRKYKLVTFHKTHSQYSKLDWYYVVSFRFECNELTDAEYSTIQTARALGRPVDARIWA